MVACEPTPQLLDRIDEKTLIIRPQTEITDIPDSLSDLSLDLRADGQLAVHYNPTLTNMDSLLRKLNEADIRIADLTTEQSDLEDIFLQLTYSADEAEKTI